MLLIHRMLRRVRGDARGDAGFTIVEMAITSALGAMVAAAIIGMLISQTRAEEHVRTFAANHEDIRQALLAMGQDLRSAEPLTEVSNPLDLRYRVDLKIYESVPSTTPLKIRWRVDATSGDLLREIVSSTDVVTETSHRLRRVANVRLGVPLFTYYRADNIAYDLGAVGTTPGTVAQCTVRVALDLRANPNGGRTPVRLASDVQLRNRIPGDPVCAG
ncbi:MAG TPA: hypothetical protein VF230_14740 [Acidimicrobiales bacterium]